MTIRRYAVPAVLWALVVAACSGTGPVDNTPAGKQDASACSNSYLCPSSGCVNPPSSSCATPDCASDPASCKGTPYLASTCYTTPGSPAAANVILVDKTKVSPPNPTATQSNNMLFCKSGPYALCFFSGPPTATGAQGNSPLPCVVDSEKNVAHCTCVTENGPYFVDINAIANFGLYNQTVSQCQSDGSGCANILNCGTDGSKCTVCDPKSPVPGCLKEAPVCQYVNQQSATATNAFYPGADLISTFGFALSPLPPTPSNPYMLGSTDCSGDKAGQYAGCMTAPCYYKGPNAGGAHGPGDPIQCDCPLYNGPFQVGQDGQCCGIAPGDKVRYAWSAAYTAWSNSPTPR